MLQQLTAVWLLWRPQEAAAKLREANVSGLSSVSFSSGAAAFKTLREREGRRTFTPKAHTTYY